MADGTKDGAAEDTTDWAQLRHAYGSAEDIPALLHRIESDPCPELWDDLWSALCHQGSVYSASFAALPRLARVARDADPDQSVNALSLAGGIMAGEHRPHGAGDIRTRCAAEIATLLTTVNERLRTASARTDYTYLLEAELALAGAEDAASWSGRLAPGLSDGEYDVACPDCEAQLYIVLGNPGFFSTGEDYARSGTDAVRHPLLPANPAALHGVGRHLHARATADARPAVAHALTHLFGHARCPACGASFPVADAVLAG